MMHARDDDGAIDKPSAPSHPFAYTSPANVIFTAHHAAPVSHQPECGVYRTCLRPPTEAAYCAPRMPVSGPFGHRCIEISPVCTAPHHPSVGVTSMSRISYLPSLKLTICSPFGTAKPPTNFTQEQQRNDTENGQLQFSNHLFQRYATPLFLNRHRITDYAQDIFCDVCPAILRAAIMPDKHQ